MKRDRKIIISKKEKAFTLIELLAVLVILAIIALIAVPIILGIVNQARKDAFVRSTELVVSSTDIDMTVADYANGHTYTMTDGVIPNLKVGINNTKGMSGTITYGTDGIAEYALHNNKWCVKKTKDMSQAEVTEYREEDCKIDVEETSEPTLLESITSQVPNSGDSIDAGTDEEGNVTGILKNEGDYGIRFEGKDPNNYVSFNGETWRIIGIVDGKVKIIRNDSLGDMAWDDDDGDGSYDAGQDTNDWSKATLQILLNEDYYNSTGTYANNQGIKSAYKPMIDATTTWSLLGNNDVNVSKADMYNIERTTGSVYGSNPRTFTAPIGLMYPSDYGFAVKESEQCPATKNLYDYDTAECYNNDWLFNSDYQWTITPHSDYATVAFFVLSVGYVSDSNSNHNSVYNASGVRPVLNLASNVKITDGTGTIDDMYQLSL